MFGSAQWNYCRRHLWDAPCKETKCTKAKAISCGLSFQNISTNQQASLELSNSNLAEINTISRGSLMGHKTHLIVGCHNAFSHTDHAVTYMSCLLQHCWGNWQCRILTGRHGWQWAIAILAELCFTSHLYKDKLKWQRLHWVSGETFDFWWNI